MTTLYARIEILRKLDKHKAHVERLRKTITTMHEEHSTEFRKFDALSHLITRYFAKYNAYCKTAYDYLNKDGNAIEMRGYSLNEKGLYSIESSKKMNMSYHNDYRFVVENQIKIHSPNDVSGDFVMKYIM